MFFATIEDWWENNYDNSKFDSKILVSKFHSYQKAFSGMDNKVEEVLEMNDKIKNWKSVGPETRTEITHFKDSDTFTYKQEYRKFLKDPVSKKENHFEVNEEITKTSTEEISEIKIIFASHVEKLNWTYKKTEDLRTVERFYKEMTPKGIIEYQEFILQDGSMKKVTIIEKKRNGKCEINKEKTIKPDKTISKTFKTDEDLTKEEDYIEEKQNRGIEKIEKMKRVQRNETSFTESVKLGNFSEKRTTIESAEKTIGKLNHSHNDDNYEISWIITKSYFLGKSKFFKNKMHSENFYLLSNNRISEFTDFSISDDNWGIIENYEKSEGLKIEWTKNKPPLYDDIKKTMGSHCLRESVSFDYDQESILKEYISHSKALFQFTGNMSCFEYPQESVKFNHLKANESEEPCLNKEMAENACNLMKENIIANYQLLHNQSNNESKRVLNNRNVKECYLKYYQLANYKYKEIGKKLKKERGALIKAFQLLYSFDDPSSSYSLDTIFLARLK